MKRIGIIGAGPFGASLTESLAGMGAEVLLLDRKRELVSEFSSSAQTVEADATNLRALEAAGFKECDVAVVAIDDNIEASVIATLNCKELGIGKVIAKATSDMHGKILHRVGADVVVYPNRERAQRLAQALMSKGTIDLFELSEGVGVAEIDVPEALKGKTLAEARVRNKYGVTVLCIRRLAANPTEAREVIMPTAEEKMLADDKLLVFGGSKELDAFAAV